MTTRSDIFLLLVARAGHMDRTPVTIAIRPHNETAVKATSTVIDLKARYYFIVWLQTSTRNLDIFDLRSEPSAQALPHA